MSPAGVSGSASGGQLEEKIDLSAETNAKIKESESLAQAGNLQEALALLAALEKKCRVGNDNPSLIRVCKSSLELCHQVGDRDALLSTLKTLSTRRSQKSSAVRTLVQTALPWCVSEPYSPIEVTNEKEKEERDTLVNTLRDITDGKIFLERERAQLTRALASIQEREGNVAEAATVLQDVHVETYGSLSKREKVEFILEQMRLTLGAQDFIRAAIVAGKISRKHLAEEKMEDYKVQFFQLMTILHRHEKDAFELAKDYHSIYSTPSVQKEENSWMEALQAAVVFLLLSPYGNEQQDMLNRLSRDLNLEKLPACQNMIKLFLHKEIISYPMVGQEELEGIPVFSEAKLREHWHEAFFVRIIQHNVRVVALYYKRIQGSRLAQLLGLDPIRLEKEIASMASDGSVYVKIDRPRDIYRFEPPQSPEKVLTDWSTNIDQLLELVETTTHLIHKEKMTN